MSNGAISKSFLRVVDKKVYDEILSNLASFYQREPAVMLLEVTGSDAHHLLEYLREPIRGATKVLMQRHGFI